MRPRRPESPFNGCSGANQGGSGALYQLRKTPKRLAVGKKVVNQQHPILLPEVVAADHDGIVCIMGVGMDGSAVNIPVHIAALVLLGKDHRHAHRHARRHRNGDARGLDGQNLRYPGVCEKLPDFLSDLCQQNRVNLLVQEAADLQNLPGEHLALRQNFLLHQTHTLYPFLKKANRQTEPPA